MKLLPSSMAGRMLALLIAGLTVLHIGSIGLYHLGRKAALEVANERHLAERIASVKRAIAREAPAKRESLAHALSGGPLEIHWSATQMATRSATAHIGFSSLKRKLLALAPELKEDDISVRAAATLPGHTSATRFLLVSMRLDDGSWVDATMTQANEPQTSLNQVALSTTVMATGVAAVAAFLFRQLTRSLRSLADAATQLTWPTPVDETGSPEVRALSMAFNTIQNRIKRFVDDRTQMLTAISHDLRTPLTRLRLRAEDIAHPDLAHALVTELAKMEVTLDNALTFLHRDQLGEEKKAIDLGSLLESIASDLIDLGHDVTLAQTAPIIVRGRHLALKRALRNLVENAANYVRRARITIEGSADGATIVIDDWPSIPEANKTAEFAPFQHIDHCRSGETGRASLGFTIARSIIQAHGGAITLSYRAEGGFHAIVTLPR